ncbi:Type III restriction enzyme, res subunit family protein [Tritrichomonas foetus]|uniref:Type III restriction enzyme, res subunit family protein n=1 Tax=Tritrichomonas foetus TaxID=1144522 RepID=A0A1J4K3C4_9EUKA|nr:Type III restriction enzyme, res subunit family protein [Tritrichomonas foetus]|eukprot:OHT03997.1 Type III restriction enzyme, res subunit family protein [Tritrichomonas foetus]
MTQSDEVDPLDDFFNNLQDEKKETEPGKFSDDSSDTDPEEKAKSFVLPENMDDIQQDDNEDNEPEYIMPPDHTTIRYPPFIRDMTFPELKTELDNLNSKEAEQWQIDHEITVTNSDILPITKFDPYAQKFDFIGEYLRNNKITEPTPVQAQSIPIAFSGQNLIVVSPTGTGKTLSFLLPLISHVILQKPNRGEMTGPIALIISPTELLAHQTALVFHQLIKRTNISSLELTGGNLKFKQEKSLDKIVDVLIATPGRLIHLLRTIDWRICTFVVVDEADKIFESGFFRQLRSIFDYIRPNRQTMLFGATLPPSIEELSQNSLKYSVRVQIGRTGAPQENIDHNFIVFQKTIEKREWLKNNLFKLPEGLVLIFVKDKNFCQQLYNELVQLTDSIGFVHGQLPKSEREEMFNKFKFGKIRFLISTEIAARGIDIHDINTIVNFDIPEKPQSYIHRVGRTARAGRSGTAFTLLTPRDVQYADLILHHFLLCGIEPPEDLIQFVEDNRDNQPSSKVKFDFSF